MTGRPADPPAEDASPARSIYHQFRALIVSGQLGADERLPTVRQTAADLGVAPGTAAKAYRMLEADGLVVTRTAAGTRVAAGASVLPGAIVRRLRELITAADAAHARPDDVIDVLRLLWHSSPSGVPTTVVAHDD